MTMDAFKKAIWAHYRRAGRTELPWRHTRDPYAILVSEIMLQQTQVARVEGYYKRFLKRVPEFSRARAGEDNAMCSQRGRDLAIIAARCF